MPIMINELRVSLVWIKSFGKDALLPKYSDKSLYMHEFNNAKMNKSEWLLPWQPNEWQHFWQFYLNAENISLDDVDFDRAWRHLMPLRAPAMAQIITPEGLRISLEGFCFPHSVGVLATAFICPQDPLLLLDMVKKSVEIRNTDYDVVWRDDNTVTHGSLDTLAARLIDKLHEKVMDNAPIGIPLSDPLTIATVIDASGTQSNDNLATSDELLRALFGLCTLKIGWENAFDMWTGNQGHAFPEMDKFLSIERGRAIWLPEHFTEATSRIRRRTLGCYHRNQALAALQARSLTSLIRRADEFLPNDPIAITIIQPVRVAVKILNKLHVGDRSTYQSWSLRTQIGHYLDMLERVNQVIGI